MRLNKNQDEHRSKSTTNGAYNCGGTTYYERVQSMGTGIWCICCFVRLDGMVESKEIEGRNKWVCVSNRENRSEACCVCEATSSGGDRCETEEGSSCPEQEKKDKVMEICDLKLEWIDSIFVFGCIDVWLCDWKKKVVVLILIDSKEIECFLSSL